MNLASERQLSPPQAIRAPPAPAPAPAPASGTASGTAPSSGSRPASTSSASSKRSLFRIAKSWTAAATNTAAPERRASKSSDGDVSNATTSTPPMASASFSSASSTSSNSSGGNNEIVPSSSSSSSNSDLAQPGAREREGSVMRNHPLYASLLGIDPAGSYADSQRLRPDGSPRVLLSNLNAQKRLLNPPSIIEFKAMRFMIMDAPSDSNLPLYIREFQKHRVTDVVSACRRPYKIEPLLVLGICLHELNFRDGDPPPADIVSSWLGIVAGRFIPSSSSSSHAAAPSPPHASHDALPSANVSSAANASGRPTIAVHCVAGLGRAPVLVAIALIEAGMPHLEAVDFIRRQRPGAINSRQLKFLDKYKRKGKGRLANVPSAPFAAASAPASSSSSSSSSALASSSSTSSASASASSSSSSSSSSASASSASASSASSSSSSSDTLAGPKHGTPCAIM